MTKKTELEGVSGACKPREIADVYCAPEREGFSGAELLARTLTNTPANERRLRGMA